MPCCFSHSSNCGTSSTAGGEFGFEKMPAVFTGISAAAIEQELLVAFRAGDGAFHHLRLEAQVFGARPYFGARGFMLRRIAYDAAFAYLPPAHFKLRLDQDYDLAGRDGLQSPPIAGSIRVAEMKLTSQTARSTGSPKSVSSIYRALSPSCTATLGSARNRQSSWLVPTSIACTRTAPAWSRQSVKPPVEEPKSAAVIPSTSMLKCRSAPSSFKPPRPT